MRESAYLSDSEKLEVLEKRIELAQREHELSALREGKYPTAWKASEAKKEGFWKIVTIIVDLIRKFL